MGQLGDVVIPDIKSLRKSSGDLNIWQNYVHGLQPRDFFVYRDHLLGILMVLNPHRHLEADVLSMLGTTLAATD